tara:strand:- start:3452 stop:3826 length:375 start_codon:yes stop_codon:yes gene_type:complete
MAHLIRINKGDLLGKERLKMNHMLKNLYETSSGSAGVDDKETEIDVGATPVSEASIAVTDADVTAASRMIGGVAYKKPTGKDLDELGMDSFDLKFEPGAGTFNVRIKGLEGSISDKFIIWYSNN